MDAISGLDPAKKKQLLNYLLGFVSENKQQKFSEIIQHRTRHLTLVLEDIFQPHNASAVLRTCDCFGIQDVHIIEQKNHYQVNPDIALGSSKWLTLHTYSDTPSTFKALRSKGYRIVATSPHKDDCLLSELPLDEKTALVFGTELEGLSEYSLANADAFVKIPMYGFTESFNISVSAAITLYQLSEKLRSQGINYHLNENELTEIQLGWAMSTVKLALPLIHDFLRKNP
jgi:tRNA (guanosine-2'-O-)-methyltransferase